MAKTWFITGISRGFGKSLAQAAVQRGDTVIGTVRSGNADIAPGPGKLHVLPLEVTDPAAIEPTIAAAFAITGRVDVLVNNAGGVAAEKRVTPEGNEGTFAGNHLGPFLLTDRLLPLLRKAASESPAGRTRILFTSSSGHEVAELDWDDLQMLDGFVSGKAYCNAKLANVLTARALARRLAADGIVVHAMHPGVVDTNFTSHADEGMRAYMNTLDLRPPQEAADTLIWLASADEPGHSTGLYFFRRQAIPPSQAASNDALGERLWRESETLIAASGA